MFTIYEHIYSLAATMYILSCVIFSAVRYFHVCNEFQADSDYHFPDRKIACILYLFPLLLLPYTLWPSDAEAWLFVKSYYLILHPWFCSVLLLYYFGRVKAWYSWKKSTQYLSIPLLLATVTMAVIAALPGTQLDEAWINYCWAGIWALTAITLAYCGMSIRIVRKWMEMHSDDDYSSAADFPSRYARRVIVIPLFHTLPVWAVVAADSQMAMALLQGLLVVFNVVFLIYVLRSHRAKVVLDNEDTALEDTVFENAVVEDAAVDVANVDDAVNDDCPDSDDKEQSDYKTELIKKQIHKAVVEDQLFLKPHLTLEDVASQCRYGRTYLSKVFKQELGGFFNYVNTLRLDYADKYTEQHPLATLDEVATASGFTSRQALYSVKRRLRPSTQ